jgi:hypothetical protein
MTCATRHQNDDIERMSTSQRSIGALDAVHRDAVVAVVITIRFWMRRRR